MTELEQLILSQKSERDYLLKQDYQPRSVKYNIADLLASREIKLITGPRRAGKSTMALLMLRNTNFAYLNFDDGRLIDSWDEDSIMTALYSVFPKYDYLLLDEIQNLPRWELWVSKLYRCGCNLVITGSNALMLSSEMATVLTGRYLPVDIMPLSLAEAMEWCRHTTGSIDDTEDIADDYLKHGGFPETIHNRAMAETYLATLFDAIVFKDITLRHNVRHASDLSRLARYLVSNIGLPITYNSLAQAVQMNSIHTVQKFLDYMTEPYLFFFLPRYDNKLRVMTRAPRKVYIADNGFITAKAFSISPDNGRMLENAVFTELIRRGYSPGLSLFYYRSRNDREADFVIRRDTKVEEIIQVCYDLSQPKTFKREADSLVECAAELGCTALTIITRYDNRTITYRGATIRIIPITAW